MQRKQIELNPGQQVACTTAAYGTPASVPQSPELRMLYQECDFFWASKVQFPPISAEIGTSQDPITKLQDSKLEGSRLEIWFQLSLIIVWLWAGHFPSLSHSN